MDKYFTHASLFSGILGFDVAADWMGWENIFTCDNNPLSKKLAEYYFPNSIHFDDITTTNFKPYANQITVLTGGFPCQPFSASGKRKGANDTRYLWPQMLRAIREIHPRWIIGENVHGIINWSKGMVFNQVLSDMETAGYQVWPFILPALSVNAQHRRDRVFFIANTDSGGLQIRSKKFGYISRVHDKASVEFTFGNAAQWNPSKRSSGQVCPGDGLPGKLDGITLSAHKRESIKAFGNSIIPALAYMLFKTISDYEKIY